MMNHDSDMVDDYDLNSAAPSTAVAIDNDKNSQQAVKWATENLLVGDSTLIALVHVKSPTRISYENEASIRLHEMEIAKNEMIALFRPYRLFCARKGIRVVDVVLENPNVVKALLHYVNSRKISNIVVGAAKGNVLTRKFRHIDVPAALLKLAPDFCSVYVIWKEKVLNARSAKTQLTATNLLAIPHLLSLHRHSLGTFLDRHESPRNDSTKPIPESASDNIRYTRDGGASSFNHHQQQQEFGSEMVDVSGRHSDGSSSFRSSDCSGSSSDSFSPSSTFNNGNGSSNTIESDMIRLKSELKQMMDKYNNACGEAVKARKQAKELQVWKMDESIKIEKVKQAQEKAIEMADKEKAQCKAAMEATKKAQMMADLEIKRRHTAETSASASASAYASRYRKYTIEDIENGTNNFSPDLKIGEGGYGPVYKGLLDQTPVAIKVLKQDADQDQGRKQFRQEIEVLSCIRHPNMVLLLGGCPESGCLVYEYMENGSLDDRLNESPTIPWSLRFKIATEIATGLHFLHQTRPEPIVHRDLKPGNILLDRNYVAKISDVGLARLVPPSVADEITQYHITTAAGTFCYIDPEYQQTGMLGIKSDVYSLGILLLQIITGKAPMGLTHHVERAIEKGSFVEMLDPRVKDWPVEETTQFAKLALKCAEMRKKDRPDLGKVVLPELRRLNVIRQKH